MGVSQGFESYNYIVNQWFAWHDSFLLSAPSFIIKSSSYYCIVLLCSTLMCNFARCRCGKIVASTVRLFVAQCKGMLTARVTL